MHSFLILQIYMYILALPIRISFSTPVLLTLMAAHILKTSKFHHHHHHPSLRRRHSIDVPPSSLSFSTFLKPTTTTPFLSSSSSTTFSLSATAASSSSSTTSTASSTSSQTFSLDLLHHHLSAQNFRDADEETRRLLIILAGEAAQKRGYIFFSEVRFISEADLKAINDLWKQYSNNRFGYSVQKRIWEKVNKDFTRFFLKVGWMKRLDTEVEQYNYRSFPDEFIWEMNDQVPEGHLPLTNALRGTQLLNSILSHPAFKDVEEAAPEENKVDEKGTENGSSEASRDDTKTPLSKKVFKPDYSF